MDLLVDEPGALPACQVYRSGSAVGVQCASCGTQATSGSWRKGWELVDKNWANLCNKCGQRRVKILKAMGRSSSGSALPLAPGEARPPRPPPPATAAPPLAGVKRSFAALDPFNLSYSGFSWRGSATQRRRLRSDSGSSGDEGGAAPAGRPSPPSPSSLPPFGANITTGYCVQKMTDGRANYSLFWVVPGSGRAPMLAAAGVDPRQSGHFSYRSVPGAVPGTALLRCTSRMEVVAWLQAALGVNPSRVVGEAEARLPLVSVADLQRLLGGGTPLQELPARSLIASGLPAAGAAGAADAATPPSLGAQSLADRVMASMHRADRGAKVKPGVGGGGVLLPRFCCSVCKGDHAAGDCPDCYASPPPLIPNPAAAIIAGNESLAVAGDALAGLGLLAFGELESLHFDLDQLFGDGMEAGIVVEDSPMQHTSFNAILDTFSLGGAGGGGGGGVVSSPEPSPHGAATAQPMEEHAGLEDTVRAWAATLSGPVTEHWPPPGPAPPGRRWVPLSEALAILQHLSAMDLGVAALERTHISAAVGALRSHHSPAVASAAAALAAKWQSAAEAALQSAAAAAR